MKLMSMGWIDRRDAKCLSDLDLPEVVIRACLKLVAHVGKVVLGGCIVAESARFRVSKYRSEIQNFIVVRYHRSVWGGSVEYGLCAHVCLLF